MRRRTPERPSLHNAAPLAFTTKARCGRPAETCLSHPGHATCGSAWSPLCVLIPTGAGPTSLHLVSGDPSRVPTTQCFPGGFQEPVYSVCWPRCVSLRNARKAGATHSLLGPSGCWGGGRRVGAQPAILCLGEAVTSPVLLFLSSRPAVAAPCQETPLATCLGVGGHQPSFPRDAACSSVYGSQGI